jgi:hypothetical protein
MTRSADADLLLDAVQTLTVPQTVKWVQQNAHGISCTNSAVQDPLVVMLREAVVGGIGSKGGGGADGKARLPFNAGALTLYDEIDDTVAKEFHRLTHEPVHESIEKNLGAWILAVINGRRAGTITEHYEREWQRTLDVWIGRIRSMFDPSIVIEISETYKEPRLDAAGNPRLDRLKQPILRTTVGPAACPRCSERHAFDRETGDQISALVLRYFNREGDGAVLDGAVAECRFCGAMWAGERGIRELRFALNMETSGEVAQTETFV